jgi:transposase InsO family protein
MVSSRRRARLVESRTPDKMLHRHRITKGGAVRTRIEDRYNRRRRHASIGQITPVAFEQQYSRQIADSQRAA